MRLAVALRSALTMVIVAAVVLVAAIAPPSTVAQADTYSWEAPLPKGVAGHGGVKYTATATYAGHTCTMTNYIGASAGRPADVERRWQNDTAMRYGTEDLQRCFLYRFGVDLPASTVSVVVVPAG